MDTQTLFAELEFNKGKFPEDILNEAVDQHESIIPVVTGGTSSCGR